LRVGRLNLRAHALCAFIDIHDFVLADLHHVAVVQVVASDAFGLHVYAVGLLRSSNEAGVGLGHDLAVMPADDLLSICKSLSGVRPITKRPGLSSRSTTVLPSLAKSILPTGCS